MALCVLLYYKSLALGSHKHSHYSCTSLLHVSSTTELDHAGPKCLQALYTLHTWGLSSKNTKDATNCRKDANRKQPVSDKLESTVRHSKAPPFRVFTWASWFLSIWTTLLITMSDSVVAEASLIFSEPMKSWCSSVCTVCVHVCTITKDISNSIRSVGMCWKGTMLYNLIISNYDTVWSNLIYTGTLSSRLAICMLGPWVPWHSRQQRTASANKAPDVVRSQLLLASPKYLETRTPSIHFMRSPQKGNVHVSTLARSNRMKWMHPWGIKIHWNTLMILNASKVIR